MHVFNRVIQLQRRSQGLVPQRQRYEKWSISTGVSILIDTMRSPARRKKKFVSDVSSTIKRRITVFCDPVVHGDTGLIDSSSRRGAQRSPRTTGVDVAKLKLLVEEHGHG